MGTLLFGIYIHIYIVRAYEKSDILITIFHLSAKY